MRNEAQNASDCITALIAQKGLIEFAYLKTPNPLRENVVSVVNTLPRQLELDKYIDYNLQFTKSFLDPLKIILDAIGYQTEKKSTLDSFFS